MKKHFLLLFLAAFAGTSFSQSGFYFPPLTGTAWDTVSPTSLNWCPDKLDSVYAFLQQKNTKSFIILHRGKIVAEKYFGTFTRDSVWYWASAGKSLSAFLTGIAQQEGLLNINDSVSKFLGTGWTSTPPAKEGLIKIVHQLSMTTGLDYNTPDLDCKVDTCLKYHADAGTEWYYYNAPYHLVQDVVAAASGVTFNSFTNTRIKNKIGMNGLWVDYVFYSRTRDAARFGLLALNRGIWGNDTILRDQNYFDAMVNTSQNYNLSYGYLWWLNGKSSAMAPGLTLVLPGMLCPPAPADMYAALGKNDQKIYVVPSMDLVVVRFGNSAGQVALGPSSFDSDLWFKLVKALDCSTTDITDYSSPVSEFDISPNPFSERLEIRMQNSDLIGKQLELFDVTGRKILSELISTSVFTIPTSELQSGLYFLSINNAVKKIIKK